MHAAVADGGTVFNAMQLDRACGQRHLYPVHLHARRVGRVMGRLAGTCRPAQIRFHRRDVLGWRDGIGRRRRDDPSALAGLAGMRDTGRCRAGVGLHHPGFDADQMVPGPPRHGNGICDHGLWRRRDDRRADRGFPDEEFRAWRRQCRRGGNADRDGIALLRRDVRRCIRLPHRAGRLVAQGLDTERCADQGDDHRQPRASLESMEDPAVLADLGRAVPERQRGHRS